MRGTPTDITCEKRSEHLMFAEFTLGDVRYSLSLNTETFAPSEWFFESGRFKERRPRARGHSSTAKANKLIVDAVLEYIFDNRLHVLAHNAYQRKAEQKAAEEEALERAIVWLKLIDARTDNKCWTLCAEGDPGAVRFIPG